nr:hypothetical protein [Acetobacter persici]
MSITSSKLDYSAAYSEWEGPSVQPDLALFADSGSLKNLAQTGLQPGVVSGTPTFTAGVAGASLPFVTLGANAKLDTYHVFPQQLTIMSLLRMGAGQANVVSMGIDTPGLLLLQRSGQWNNWLVCGNGADQITANAGMVSGSWQICVWQCDLSTVNPQLTFQDYTTGATASGTGKFAQVYKPTQSIKLGDSGDQVAASTYDAAVHLVWDSLLGAADLNTNVAWLRQFAQAYGTSA